MLNKLLSFFNHKILSKSLICISGQSNNCCHGISGESNNCCHGKLFFTAMTVQQILTIISLKLYFISIFNLRLSQPPLKITILKEITKN